MWVAGLALHAQWFAGAGGGVATLSADGATRIDAGETAVSLYKPENGPVVHVFAGRHLHDYFSIQGSYTWNRNAAAITGTRFGGGEEATFERVYQTRSQSVAVEGMIYFRRRGERFRPYLSGGAGVARMAAEAVSTTVRKGAAVLPADRFTAAGVLWRTAVGIDIRAGRGFSVRYNFWETLSANPISRQLAPRGGRGLANFQNVISVFRTF